jgi:hypothetical protein
MCCSIFDRTTLRENFFMGWIHLYWLVLTWMLSRIRWLSSVRIAAGNRANFPLRVMGFLCGLLYWRLLFPPRHEGVDKRRLQAGASGLVPPAHEGGTSKNNRRVGAFTMGIVPHYNGNATINILDLKRQRLCSLSADNMPSPAVFGVSPKTLPSFSTAPDGVGRIIVRLASGRS